MNEENIKSKVRKKKEKQIVKNSIRKILKKRKIFLKSKKKNIRK